MSYLIDNNERTILMSTTATNVHEFFVWNGDNNTTYNVELYGEQLAYDEREGLCLYRTTTGQVLVHNYSDMVLWGFDKAETHPAITYRNRLTLANTTPAFFNALCEALDDRPMVEVDVVIG
jgi:hypothetical protein